MFWSQSVKYSVAPEAPIAALAIVIVKQLAIENLSSPLRVALR